MADSQQARSQDEVDRVLSQLSQPKLVKHFLVELPNNHRLTFEELLRSGQRISHAHILNIQESGVDFSVVNSLEQIIAGVGNDPTEDDRSFVAHIRQQAIISGPTIPPRTSSKRHASAQLQVDMRTSTEDLRAKQRELKIYKKRLTSNDIPARSMHSPGYWKANADLGDIDVRQNRLQVQRSFQDFNSSGRSTPQEFFQTEEFKRLQSDTLAAADSRDLMEQHANYLDQMVGDIPAPVTRTWVAHFMTNQLRFSRTSESSFGKKDHNATEQARGAIFSSYNAAKETPEYCPVTGLEFPKCTAAHITPASYGEELMRALFGEEQATEINTDLNVMPMNTQMEKAFDDFQWCFVPDVEDRKNVQEMEQWYSMEPKEYKVLVFDKENATKLEDAMGWDRSSPPRIKDFDGKKVQFRSDTRPRARYLYFHACCAFLTNERRGKGKPNIQMVQKTKDELYWGTAKSFFTRTTLVGFSQILHHEYKHLFPIPTDPAEIAEIDENEARADGFAAAMTMYEHSRNKDRRQALIADLEDEDEDEGEEEAGPSAAVQSLNAVLASTREGGKNRSDQQKEGFKLKDVVNRSRRAFSM